MEQNNQTTKSNEGRSPDVGTSAWFDALDNAANALHDIQGPLRGMNLPAYPAGGTCGISNLCIALEAIMEAQGALRSLRDQLGHWCAMDAAYGHSSNTEATNFGANKTS